MTQIELKSHIRAWLKKQREVNSDLGLVKVGSPLGEGGNALVFETSFAGGTAIKFLAEEVKSTPSTRYIRFLNEYRNLVKIVSTGKIIPLYQYGIQDMDGRRIPYIIMEKCQYTLANIYKENKIKTKEGFAFVLDSMLSILEVVHSSGIVHRDIKPENILMRFSGDLVLGDFGIAWFDPETYTEQFETQKSERLANFEFSAPEQVRRNAYDTPTPSMDLYALGQTLYWCVTGNTIKGSGYLRLSNVVVELSQYDALIEKLVRQLPNDRFQTVNEVRQYLTELFAEVKDPDSQRMSEFHKQIILFEDVIKKSSPGSYRYKRITIEKEINRVLLSLSDVCNECELWWNSTLTHNPACPIKQLSNEQWLIAEMECKIVELMIYRYPTLERQYILLHLAPLDQFDIYDTSNGISDAAGLFYGQYVTHGELDDGYAVINGEVVKLENAELRRRNLKDKFMFISPRLSIVGMFEHDDIRDKVIERLEEKNSIEEIDLEPLERLKRASWMGAWD